MSIDFSKIAGLSDQRGKVVQVADESGKVLWSAEKPHKHKNGEPVLVREPTCTKPAEYAVYCMDCGVEVDRYEDDGVFAEHIPDGGRVTKEPTCTTAGAYTYYCRECGTWVKADAIPALGHTWGNPYYSNEFSSGYGQKCSVCGELAELDYVDCEHPASSYHEAVITNPSCTVAGSKTCSCDVCRSSWSVSIAALGHSYTSEVIAPTCTDQGYTKHTCSRCGHSYNDSETDPNGHNFAGGWVVTKSATCTATGTERRTCLTCGYYEERPLDATGHSYTSKVTAPTCTTKGYTTHTCSVCGDSYTDSETAALGHKKGNPVCVREATCTVAPEYAVYCTVCGVEVDRYEDDGGLVDHVADDGIVTTQPTCVATGIRKYYCRECRTWVRDEVIPATGTHTYNNVVTAPTCTAGGYTTHTCTVCGDSYKDTETDPNGHSWGVNGGWATVTPATCENKGTEKHTCNSCGLVETRDIPATGHSYTSKVTAPTCTTKGYTTHTCSVCGDSYTDGETDALGHNSGSPVLTREPTCTVPAEYTIYCTRCSVQVSRYENDGEFAEHIADGGRVTTEPTCTKTGVRTYYCRECDTWLREEVVAALGHDYQYDYTEDATCEKGGYDVYTCTQCGDWYTTNETDPNGHNFVGGWMEDKAPTCTESGTEKRVCLNCEYTETRSVDALGHDWREPEPDPSVSSGTSITCNRCGVTEEY